MSFKRIISILSLLIMLPGSLAACGAKGKNETPTPTPTAVPAPTEDDGSEKLTAYEYVKIASLDGEDVSQTKWFYLKSGELSIAERAHEGSGSFCLDNRENASHGVLFRFQDIEKEITEIAGKKAYLAVWVYQATGKTAAFTCSLDVKSLEGVSSTVARIEFSVPSKEWTLLETEFAVPGNINLKSAEVTLTMSSSSAAFYIDDLYLSYDPVSEVPDFGTETGQGDSSGGADEQPTPVVVEDGSVDFSELSFGFEDGEVIFGKWGNSSASVVKGGHSSPNCMAVRGRNEAWNGARADFSKYAFAGKTVEFSYWAYHEAYVPFAVTLVVEQERGTGETVRTEIASETFKQGKWAQVTGTVTFAPDVKKCILYFEATDRHADFYIDDLELKVQ